MLNICKIVCRVSPGRGIVSKCAKLGSSLVGTGSRNVARTREQGVLVEGTTTAVASPPLFRVTTQADKDRAKVRFKIQLGETTRSDQQRCAAARRGRLLGDDLLDDHPPFLHG